MWEDMFPQCPGRTMENQHKFCCEVKTKNTLSIYYWSSVEYWENLEMWQGEKVENFCYNCVVFPKIYIGNKQSFETTVLPFSTERIYGWDIGLHLTLWGRGEQFFIFQTQVNSPHSGLCFSWFIDNSLPYPSSRSEIKDPFLRSFSISFSRSLNLKL